MPQKEIKIKVFVCSQCKHTWQERKEARKHKTSKPALCPKCKSPYWDYEGD